MIQIIHQPVAGARPFLETWTVLQVIHFCISRLPALQGHTITHEAKLYWWRDELKAFQFDLLSELAPEVEADARAKGSTHRSNHSTTAG